MSQQVILSDSPSRKQYVVIEDNGLVNLHQETILDPWPNSIQQLIVLLKKAKDSPTTRHVMTDDIHEYTFTYDPEEIPLGLHVLTIQDQWGLTISMSQQSAWALLDLLTGLDNSRK